MPLTRYQTRSEYGLADPDLYRAADKDDPEALLEGVAMAGLVGILRQLGDLAEFAAEMFHDLHEEVMATAARSHGLMARVQQLEADFPSIEKALLCQTDHSPYFPKTGVQWHPTLQLEQNVVTRGDLPRCVMDSYEECRGPPRLFLLDKFDIAGAGACLKRYTDPSFVRLETLSYEASWDDIQREKKSQKGKRRGSHWRNGGTTENALSSHAKLHELFLEEHLEARLSDPARIVKLKSRKLDGYSPFSKSGESYMEKFVQSCVDNKTGYEIITSNPELLTCNIDSAKDVVSEIPEISMMGAQDMSHEGTRAEFSFPNEQENAANMNLHVGLIEKDIETVPESSTGEVLGTTMKLDSQTNLNGKSGGLQYRSYSEDLTSEADNYVDAPATMESETETDNEGRAKNTSGALKDVNYRTNSEMDEKRIEDPPQFSDSHSIGYMPVSENEQSSLGKRSVSFSSSDVASISMDDQSDREKSSGCLLSTVNFKSEVVDSLCHITPSENKEYHDLHFQKSVSSSNVDGHASFSSHCTTSSSSPRSVSKNAESYTLTVQSLAPEVVKTSPESGLDQIKGGDDQSRVDPIDASVSGTSFDVKNLSFSSRASSSSSVSEGSRYDNTIDKNYMVDCSSNIVYSGTCPQMSVDSLTGKQLPAADIAIKTNSAVACSDNLASLDSVPKSCDGSQTENLLPYSVGLGMEVSPDMLSKVAGPITVDENFSKDTLDDETDHIKVTNAVADVDSQSLAAEISNEHSCALGNDAAVVSVSESREVTLNNEMSMSSEVENSKPTSDINSGVEKLEADASSTSSKYDEQICDISAEFSSNEGCHDHPQLDDATTDILPRVEPVVSENFAGTYCGDVRHAITLSSTVNAYQSSSEDGEICQEKIVESERTIQADNNPEEEKMQKNLFDVSSEALGVAPDNNDLPGCESLIPLSSLDQRERDDTETKSPCKSTLIDNGIDSSPVDNMNLSESITLEQSAKVLIPWASHALVDEELLQSSVLQTSEFVPQSEAMDSLKQALNLEPAFPGFGLIPETTPTNQVEIPPLPPLPPMQWRIGKAPHSNVSTFVEESVETSSSPFSVETAIGSSLNTEIGAKPSGLPVSLGSDKSEQLPEEFVTNASVQPLQSSSPFPTTGSDLNSQYDSFVSQITQSAFLSDALPTMANQPCMEDFSSEESNLLADHAAQTHELDLTKDSSLQLPQDPSVNYEYIMNDTCSHVSEKSIGDHHFNEVKASIPTQSTKVEDMGHTIIPHVRSAETAEPSNSLVQMIIPFSVGDAMWPVSAFTVAPTLDGKHPEEVPMVKLPRPRSPLVDAVAAHDRRTMKKVSERIRPPVKQKEDDQDSLLAQIRSKSVNLKPAVMTRPSIQTGPKTNLRVAAILEKANTIRQAMAGSDEDDDSDGWSDS